VLATGYALQTLGLERISATATGFSTSLFLPLTPLLAAGLFGERIRRRGWFATGLASFGLVLLAGGNRGPLGANLLVLGGAVCFAGHLVLTGRVARSHDPTRLALAQMATCAMVFGVVAVASEPLEPPRGVSLWAAIVVTGVFASALGFAVQTWAQRRMTATQTAIVIGAEPVSAGVVGVAFGGESLGPAATIGCIAILAAIVTGCRCR
jgi:drug/metabolite transporter (DMT)-like permease